MVSKELLQKQGVTTGGEGCQWPIGMAISKDGKLVLYGTDVGGIYRSEDGGKNWEQSNVGLQSRGAGAFSIDPKNPSYVVAVGINGSPFNTNGLYISEDGGKSFQVITSNKTNSIVKQGRQGGFETNSLEVNPKTGELLFAGGCFGIAKLSPPYKLNN